MNWSNILVYVILFLKTDSVEPLINLYEKQNLLFFLPYSRFQQSRCFDCKRAVCYFKRQQLLKGPHLSITRESDTNYIDDGEQIIASTQAKIDAQEMDRRRTLAKKAKRKADLWSEVADPQQRAVASIRRSLEFRKAEMSGKICQRCWAPLSDCVCCSADEDVFASMPHRIIIYLHYKEFGRFSNTGALLLSAFPNQTELIVAGLPEEEERLRGLLLQAPSSAMILWPHGAPLAAFLDRAAASAAGGSSGPAAPAARGAAAGSCPRGAEGRRA